MNPNAPTEQPVVAPSAGLPYPTPLVQQQGSAPGAAPSFPTPPSGAFPQAAAQPAPAVFAPNSVISPGQQPQTSAQVGGSPSSGSTVSAPRTNTNS
ncbi:MAG: hypothetical protein ABIV43_01250, partial [Candidatus Saccharimonadales bacterium]